MSGVALRTGDFCIGMHVFLIEVKFVYRAGECLF